MGIFDDLATDEITGTETDSVGGNYSLLESGIVDFVFDTVYATESKGGAKGVVVNVKTADGKSMSQTIYITSGKAKGQKPFYIDKKDGSKQPLPGFSLANNMALLSVGKKLTELKTEKKFTNVYNYDQRKEVPVEVDMFVELLGQSIKAGVQKQLVDKNAADANGVYQPTGETREQNEFDKFFRASDGMTSVEISAGVTEPTFMTTWAEKWTGKLVDKTKGISGTAGAPKAPAASGAPTEPLFELDL